MSGRGLERKPVFFRGKFKVLLQFVRFQTLLAGYPSEF